MRARRRPHRRINEIEDALSFGISAPLKRLGIPQPIRIEAMSRTFRSH